jgi:hypothetical protein
MDGVSDQDRGAGLAQDVLLLAAISPTTSVQGVQAIVIQDFACQMLKYT